MDILDLIDQLQDGGPDAQSLIEVLADLLRADGKSQFIRDSEHAIQTRVLSEGLTVTTDVNTVGRDVIGTSQFDTLNFISGGGVVRVNAANPRQADIPRGAGGGADCMFDYLVSGCFATLAGFSEGQAFTSLSGCTFYGYSTVQGAVTAAIATASKKVIYICGGTYAESVVIDVGGNHPDRQPDLIGAGNDRTFINSIYVFKGGNSNSGWDIMRDFGLTGDGSRIFRTEKSLTGFNAGLKLKCVNVTFGVTGGAGGEIFIAEANNSFFESCEFMSASEWFNIDNSQIHTCLFLATVTMASGSGSTCNRIVLSNSTFRNAKISVPGGFAQGLQQCSFTNNLFSLTGSATAFVEVGASGTSTLQNITFAGNAFINNGGTLSTADINIISITGASSAGMALTVTGNTWNNAGVPFVKSADADLNSVAVVGNTQLADSGGKYVETQAAPSFTCSGNFNNSVFGLNAPGQVTNYSLTGTGNTVDGIGQVTAAPTYGAAEGSLAFDKTANTMYVNTDGGTTWAIVGVAGGGGAAAANEAYVTIGNTSGLSAERALTPIGAYTAVGGVGFVDAGANSTVTATLKDLTANWTQAGVFDISTAGNLTVLKHAAIGSSSAISTTQILSVAETFTNPAGDVDGAGLAMTINLTAGNANNFDGFHGTVVLAGTGSASGIVTGVHGNVQSLSGAATESDVRSMWAQASAGAGKVYTNRYGLYISDGTGSGTFTNQYGLYIENMAKGGTLNRAIYSAGGNSVHAGSFTIGGTAAPSTTLDVRGATTLDGIAAPSTPASDDIVVYNETGTDFLKAKDDNGAVYNLTSKHLINVMVDGTVTNQKNVVGPMPQAGTIVSSKAKTCDAVTIGATAWVGNAYLVTAANADTDGGTNTIYSTAPSITNGHMVSTNDVLSTTTFAAGDYFVFATTTIGTSATMIQMSLTIRYT